MATEEHKAKGQGGYRDEVAHASFFGLAIDGRGRRNGRKASGSESR
jgi:hypothetical protein